MKRIFRFAALTLLIWGGAGFSQYVEDSIDVGAQWVEWLVYNSHGDVVYGLSDEGIFFAIACSTNQLISTFPTKASTNIVYNSTLNRAYFCNYVDNDCDSVIVVDGTTHQRINAIPLLETIGEGDAVYVAWDSVSNRLYVSCTYYDEYQEEDTIAIIDCETDSVLGYIPIAQGAVWELYFNLRFPKMYSMGRVIDVIDLLQNRVVKEIETGGTGAYGGCYLSNVDKFYCGVGKSIYVIDGVTDSLLRRISLFGYEIGALSNIRNTSLILAAAGPPFPPRDSDLVYVIDGVRDSVIRRFSVAPYVAAFVQSPVTKLIYCIASGSRSVIVFDSACTRMITRIPVGSLSGSGVASHLSQRIYLASWSSRYVYVIRDVLGVEEIRSYEPMDVTPTTIVRNSVFWKDNEARLIDITGRRIEILRTGENNLTFLPPGVYLAIDKMGRVKGKVIRVR